MIVGDLLSQKWREEPDDKTSRNSVHGVLNVESHVIRVTTYNGLKTQVGIEQKPTVEDRWMTCC